jgi:hypothetical protein
MAQVKAEPQPQPQPQPLQQPQPQPQPPQPNTIACDECVRGQQLLELMGPRGDALLRDREFIVETMVGARIPGSGMDGAQEGTLREMLSRHGGELLEPFAQLEGRSNDELLEIGFALCNSPDRECATLVAAGLKAARQLATEGIGLPQPYGLPHGHPGTCDPTVAHVRSPKAGFGFEYANGWQRSANPVDGAAWSLGIEGRRRFTNKLGMVARVDRSTGRDEARDEDGDGRDDVSTGAVTRWTMMAGPSLVLTSIRDRDLSRYWQVDSLVGLSRDASRSGPIAAIDISYQLVVARIGVRVIAGLGDASEEAAGLLHAGFMVGAGPQYSYGAGCGVETRPRGSAWAIGLHIPLSGWAQGVGYVTPGFGLEGALHVHETFDVVLHGDVMVMPSGDRDRAFHQALLAGARLDLSSGSAMRKGFIAALLAGYDHVATASSAAIQSGPIIDGSIGYVMQASDGAIYWRLHGRFGVTEDNRDLRAVFASFGMELRLDRSRWGDRN